MGDVRLHICGRQYDVHCADGQEAQLERLAEMVETRARTVAGGTEVRQLLFAALMLADEMQELQSGSKLSAARTKPVSSEEKTPGPELQQALDRANARIAALEASLASAPAPASSVSPGVTRALEKLADRIEALADSVVPTV